MGTKEYCFLIFFFLLLFGIVYKYTNLFRTNDKYQGLLDDGKIYPEIENFKGICLFDIDGTLTDGIDNYNVVQKCIDSGYAVGISTAGSMYKTTNIQNFPWMPINLYNFMKNRNFDTFNNVNDSILCGNNSLNEYNNLFVPYGMSMWGIRKALALEKTAKNLGITEPSKMIMFDNDPGYIDGMRSVNPNFTLICAGEPCGGKLDVENVRYALSSWNGN